MKKPVQITLYFADWCGHCIKFKPTWEEMKTYKNQHSEMFKNIELAEFESKKLRDLKKKDKTINGLPIEGYPTIKIEIRGKEYNYEEERSPSAIYKYIIDTLKKEVRKQKA